MTILIIGNGKQGKRFHELIPDSELIPYRDQDWKYEYNLSGVIIATRPAKHIEVAEYFLQQGVPVLIEKPLALSSKEAKKLLVYNQDHILVNHTQLFSFLYQQKKKNFPPNLRVVCNGPIEREDCSSLFDYGSHAVAVALDLGPNVKWQTKKRDQFEFGIIDRDKNYPVYSGDPSCLQQAIQVFRDMIAGKKTPLAGVSLGIKVLEMLEEREKESTS